MNIKHQIKSRGWTIAGVAAQMMGRNGVRGVTQSSLSQIINGNPTVDKLIEIASILGITLSELVADDEPHQPDAIATAELHCPYCNKLVMIQVIPLEPTGQANGE